MSVCVCGEGGAMLPLTVLFSMPGVGFSMDFRLTSPRAKTTGHHSCSSSPKMCCSELHNSPKEIDTFGNAQHTRNPIGAAFPVKLLLQSNDANIPVVGPNTPLCQSQVLSAHQPWYAPLSANAIKPWICQQLLLCCKLPVSPPCHIDASTTTVSRDQHLCSSSYFLSRFVFWGRFHLDLWSHITWTAGNWIL